MIEPQLTLQIRGAWYMVAAIVVRYAFSYCSGNNEDREAAVILWVASPVVFPCAIILGILWAFSKFLAPKPRGGKCPK